jgi:elongation factor Tu
MSQEDMFNIEITNAFIVSGRAIVVSGRVLMGTVCIGDRALLKTPAGQIPTLIAGVEIYRKSLDIAYRGDKAGILLQEITMENLKPYFVGEGESRRQEQVFLASPPPREA